MMLYDGFGVSCPGVFSYVLWFQTRTICFVSFYFLFSLFKWNRPDKYQNWTIGCPFEKQSKPTHRKRFTIYVGTCYRLGLETF